MNNSSIMRIVFFVLVFIAGCLIGIFAASYQYYKVVFSYYAANTQAELYRQILIVSHLHLKEPNEAIALLDADIDKKIVDISSPVYAYNTEYRDYVLKAAKTYRELYPPYSEIADKVNEILVTIPKLEIFIDEDPLGRLDIQELIKSRNSTEPALWNEDCPSAVSDNEQYREALKKEFADFESGLGLLLDLQKGQKITEPNESFQKEMALTEKVVREVFKPGIILLESLKDKFLISDVYFTSKKEQVLIFSVKNDKYIIQFMKLSYTIYLTIRPTSGKAISIPELATDIFTNRILPTKWEADFYIKELKRDSKILKAGFWHARDTFRITPSGKAYSIEQFNVVKTGRVWVPLGEGLYSLVNFNTDGKFALFTISGGPKPLQKDAPEYPGSSGTGSFESKDVNSP
jgi:hypothetical protein